MIISLPRVFFVARNMGTSEFLRSALPPAPSARRTISRLLRGRPASLEQTDGGSDKGSAEPMARMLAEDLSVCQSSVPRHVREADVPSSLVAGVARRFPAKADPSESAAENQLDDRAVGIVREPRSRPGPS